MKSLMIHGCYDLKTLKTLESFGNHELVFDLRVKSPNLIPFHHLKELLKSVQAPQVLVSFADDKIETVESALNILKDAPQTLIPLFRDQRPASFYHDLDRAFFWMFHPEGDWRTILALPGIRGILLPLKWQDIYEKESGLWNLIEANNLETYLHADSFEEASAIDMSSGVKLSIDLTSEIEVGFRTVDQEKLKRMKIWRKLNESSLS